MDRFKQFSDQGLIEDESISKEEEILKLAPDFLRSVEGFSETPYADTSGKQTVGTGLNLQSPATLSAAERAGIPLDRDFSAEPLLDEEDQKIKQEVLKDTLNYYNNIKKQDFPSFDETIDQQLVLLGLMYQNPELMGPNMRKSLFEGDERAAAEEILLRSNKLKNPGIQKRRLVEAEKFLGPEAFSDLYNNLSDEEKQQVVNLLDQIESPGTKEQLYRDYPFLKQVAPPKNFKKLLP